MKEEGTKEWRAGNGKQHEAEKRPPVQEANQQRQRQVKLFLHG